MMMCLKCASSYLCFSQCVSVLDGEAERGGKGEHRVLRESGGDLFKRQNTFLKRISSKLRKYIFDTEDFTLKR